MDSLLVMHLKFNFECIIEVLGVNIMNRKYFCYYIMYLDRDMQSFNNLAQG